jgi:hypothetical protein
MRASYSTGQCDENTKSACVWNRQLSNATSPQQDSPSFGKWWYGVQARDQSLPSGNCISEAGGHCGGVDSDRFDPRSVVGPILVEIPISGGLVPCGRKADAVDTPYNETETCELRHFFLLLRNVINFVLWWLIPIILILLVVLTGAVFYFSFGGLNAMAYVRRIWRAFFAGAGIVFFSWLFLNFLLGILGFNINVFGQWTQLQF